MIEIDKPLDKREPLEVLELNFYRLRLHDDNLVRALEKLQAAAVAIVAQQEFEARQLRPDSIHLQAASKSLMHAYQFLAQERVENETTLKGLASYLEMNDIEVFDSMQDLILAQEILKTIDDIE